MSVSRPGTQCSSRTATRCPARSISATGRSSPLKGKLEGDKIEFVFVMPDLDGDQPINLSGSVDPDSNTIAGDEGSFSWYGMGSWTAVKEAAEG